MSFSSQKGEFDRFFNRLDRPVEESRPDRQPDRFPSLIQRSNLDEGTPKSRWGTLNIDGGTLSLSFGDASPRVLPTI